MHSRRIFFLSFLILAALAIFGALYSVNARLAAAETLGRDFRLYRAGGRYFLLQAVNPYRFELAAQIRREVFGLPLSAGGYPHRLEYPFYILLFYLPFSAIKNVNLALALWMLMLQMALAATLILHLRVLLWRPPPAALFLLFLLAFFWHYDLIALLDGNASLLLALFFAGLLLSLQEGSEEAAGLLLALSTFKWEAGGLLIVFILLWAVFQRRWRFLSFFAIGLGILLLLITVLLPSWLQPFFQSVFANLRNGKGFSTFQLFQLWWPGLGQKLAWGLTGLLALTLFLEWRLACRHHSQRRFVWTAALTLAVTPLLGLPIELANLALLTFPILLVLATAVERWRRLSGWFLALGMVGLIAWPWLQLFSTNSPERATYQLAILLPAGLALLLYWLKWWAVRPPRLWIDQLKAETG